MPYARAYFGGWSINYEQSISEGMARMKEWTLFILLFFRIKSAIASQQLRVECAGMIILVREQLLSLSRCATIIDQLLCTWELQRLLLKQIQYRPRAWFHHIKPLPPCPENSMWPLPIYTDTCTFTIFFQYALYTSLEHLQNHLPASDICLRILSACNHQPVLSLSSASPGLWIQPTLPQLTSLAT